MVASKGHLVIVCCHAIYSPYPGGSQEDESPYDRSDMLKDEFNWQLEDFQRGNSAGKLGEHFTFIQHIKTGWELYSWEDEGEATLILTGGPTKNTDMSESASYLNVLKSIQRYANPSIQADSVFAESYATDSYQNLLFSIIKYWSENSYWPERITVITHAFKANRFLKLHAPAIKWPEEKFRVVGIDPPFSSSELQRTQELERLHGYGPWKSDPYGAGSLLSAKRLRRNWDSACLQRLCELEKLPDVVKTLLTYQGTAIFPHLLPWEEGGGKTQGY